MQKIYPCLWFDGKAEDAANFYTSLFKNAKTGKMARFGEVGSAVSGQKNGSVMTLEFELEGQNFLSLNGGPHFKFTPAISFFVYCETEQEIDQLWKKFVPGGSILWELNTYPWAQKYGWCQDKFGVSWQLILGSNPQKIAPAFLFVDQLFGKGEEAINFYTSLFKNSKIESLERNPTTQSIIHARFSLEGQNFVLMEGQGSHTHAMTPAISMVINCQTQDEIDYYWDKLTKGGSSGECGWLNDKFGVSWQVTPSILRELISDPDHLKTEKVMSALVKMKKLDIEALKKAYMS